MEINDKRVHQQIRNFERCVNEYGFQEPFARFLTQFYKHNKQMGSSDRRANSRYCYNFFRLGKAFSALSKVEKLQIAEFLCEKESGVIALFQPTWLQLIESPLAEKISFIEEQFGSFLDQVFPFSDSLSKLINPIQFISSHFIQPDLFIRCQRGKDEQVIRGLEKLDIPFKRLETNSLALPNGSNLQALNKLQGAYEVQDWASQQTINFIPLRGGASWWDCCAASGGKSLMMLDQEPNLKLLVSDIRLSILRNLDERFEQAKIKTYYRKKILDLRNDVKHLMQDELFEGVLLDAPCTGSGTWGRTPEMLTKFEEGEIERFSILQKAIAKQVVPYIKSGKTLVYITCSVFEKENEEVARYIKEELGLEMEVMESILGYGIKADSMFIARFKKS